MRASLLLCLWLHGLTFGRLKLNKKLQLIKPMYNQSMARGFHQPKSRPHEFGNDYQKIKPLPRKSSSTFYVENLAINLITSYIIIGLCS